METSLREQCQAFGESRLAVAKEAKTPEDWVRLWKDPAYPYTFRWGTCWTFCIEYKVEDFAAEIGFFLDILGLDSNALGADFAMLMSPDNMFYFAVKPAQEGGSTPPDAIRLQFMLSDLLETAAELEKRGVEFESEPQPVEPDSPLYHGLFRTPHGIAVDLWGLVERQVHRG